MSDHADDAAMGYYSRYIEDCDDEYKWVVNTTDVGYMLQLVKHGAAVDEDTGLPIICGCKLKVVDDYPSGGTELVRMVDGGVMIGTDFNPNEINSDKDGRRALYVFETVYKCIGMPAKLEKAHAEHEQEKWLAPDDGAKS